MSVGDADLALDRALTDLSGLMPLLSLVTPTNVAEAREAFSRGEDPQFEYRALPDLHELEKRLGQIQAEQASDPSIATMAERLIRELGLRLEMLRTRCTDRFFLVAVEMFGHVDEPTLELAQRILAVESQTGRREPTVDAEELARMARRELEHYQRVYPEMVASVHLSSTRPGVMVETGVLHIGRQTRIGRSRVDQLLQHEVGTHILTFENGRAQPLQILSLGLAGYDELQEALGVLAEHLCGGIRVSRLRVLAYRVIAAHMRSEGALFRETFDRLTALGATKGVAFSTSMRAHRAGGMTKDAIYLRGLTRLLEHLVAGVELEGLFIGKIAFDSIPMVTDLRERGVLVEPPLTPRFLAHEGAAARLAEIRQGQDLLAILGAAA